MTCPRRLIKRGDVDPIHRILTSARPGCDRSKLKKAFLKRLEELSGETGQQTVLLSHETIFGLPFEERGDGFYPDFMARLSNFQYLIEGTGIEVDVVFFIRDYCDFISSSYVQYVKMGGTYSLSRFVSSYDAQALGPAVQGAVLRGNPIAWEPITQALQQAFPGRVRIVDFTQFFATPSENLSRIFFDGAVSLEDCRGLESIRVNSSPPMVAVHLARHANIVLKYLTKLPKRKIGHVSSAAFIGPAERFHRFRLKGLALNKALVSFKERYRQDLQSLVWKG